MEHVLKLSIGTFYIHNNYLIVNINEGKTVNSESNTILKDIIKKYYASKKFVYITHRIHSYAVDTAVYLGTSKIKNLVGFAVVSSKIIALFNAEIERQFLKKPFEIFTNIEDAIDWAESIVEEK
jgi:hypothetical protein